jgi:hypothetical protein
MWAKWWIYLVGVVVLLMGLLALVYPLFGVNDPWWHAVLKIIVGAITVYAGMQLPD